MKKIIIALLTFLFITFSVHAEDKLSIKLNYCIDGDTASFIINDEITKVRFLAINTPESVSTKTGIEYLGKEASEYTCTLLTNAKTIEIEYDKESDKKDKYNRDLGWIYVDNQLIQELLLAKGYAEIKYIYGNYAYLDKLYKIQDNAKKENIGIWSSQSNYETINYHTVTIYYDDDNIKYLRVYDTEKIKKLDNPEKKGCTFLYWQYNANEFDFNTHITKDIVIKAKYIDNRLYFFVIIPISIIIYLIKKRK